MENPQNSVPTVDPPENMEVVQMNIDEAIENVRQAAYWFFGIAALSLINSFLASRGVYFILGLGLTQFIDGIVIALTGEINYFISLMAPLLFIVIGYFAATAHRWAFVVGALIYVLDAILYLYFMELLAFGFHAFILYKLYKGYRTISEYEELTEKMNAD